MLTNKSVISKKRDIPKNFAINRKIVDFISELNMSINKFAGTLGFDRPDNIYNIVHEKVEASTKIVNRILSVYPEFTRILYRSTGVSMASDNPLQYDRKKKACKDCKAKDKIINSQHRTIKALQAELSKSRKQ